MKMTRTAVMKNMKAFRIISITGTSSEAAEDLSVFRVFIRLPEGFKIRGRNSCRDGFGREPGSRKRFL
jgi:hypothetical protein